MKTILILLTLAFLILIIRAILKSRGKVEREKTAPSEVAIASELGLDESHRFGNVMDKTWEYFDSHPGTDAGTYIHSIIHDRACFVSEVLHEEKGKAVKLTFDIDDGVILPHFPLNADGQPGTTLYGPDARHKAGEIIKSVLELTDGSLVSHQIAGSDGPEHYFDIIRQ